MALALSKAGADLILVQRNTTNTATQDQIRKEGGADGKGGKADVVICDLASKADVAKLVPGIVDSGRVLDIVVNCGELDWTYHAPPRRQADEHRKRGHSTTPSR